VPLPFRGESCDLSAEASAKEGATGGCPGGAKSPALTHDDIIFNQLARKNPNIITLATSLGLVNNHTKKPFVFS